MVGKRIGITKERYQNLLAPNPDFPENAERVYAIDRFRVDQPLEVGTPVLIIDDTFTSGSRIQSAAALLKSAGSGPIGVVCIGRHFSLGLHGEYGIAARNYVERSRALGWHWDYCCLCDHRTTKLKNQ
jgi:hypothetical protein